MIPHPHYLQSPVQVQSQSQQHREPYKEGRDASVESFNEAAEYGAAPQAGPSVSLDTPGYPTPQASLDTSYSERIPDRHDDEHIPDSDNLNEGAGPPVSHHLEPSSALTGTTALSDHTASGRDTYEPISRSKTSRRASSSRASASSPSPPPPPPRPRLRSTVSRVVQLNRSTTIQQSPGAEQGIDPRRDSAAQHWGYLQQECSIEVIDYSSVRVSIRSFDNASFSEFMNAEGKDRPEWARVRWINVGGISFDIIRILALRYDLHPLATEDVLRCFEDAESGRSKSDYYRTHLFLSIIAHTLGPDDSPPSYDEATDVFPLGDRAPTHPPHPGVENDAETSTEDSHTGLRGRIPSTSQRRPRRSSIWQRARQTGVAALRRSFSKDDIESTFAGRDLAVDDDDEEDESGFSKPREEMTEASAIGRRKAVNSAALRELKRGSHVSVELKHVYLFLTRGGTLITIHQEAGQDFFAPIRNRLKHPDTLLRAHCDPSLLMQSVLDLVVDKALEVVDRYHDTLLDLERQILIKPSVKSVRQLHIMSGDITLHKRTLTPLSTLVYSLRRYDQDRAIASFPADTIGDGSEEGKPKVQGFCSHQAKVYLADVYDHMEYILSSMDMFSSIAENLINFTFNIVSYETNQSMRRLTIATVVFFPLTFLTGYFGMNFTYMESLQGSDLFFWEITIPIMSTIIFLFTFGDLKKMIRAARRNKVWERQMAMLRLPRRRSKK